MAEHRESFFRRIGEARRKKKLSENLLALHNRVLRRTQGFIDCETQEARKWADIKYPHIDINFPARQPVGGLHGYFIDTQSTAESVAVVETFLLAASNDTRWGDKKNEKCCFDYTSLKPACRSQ